MMSLAWKLKMISKMSKEEYLQMIELLAKEVVSAAIKEDSFEIFLDGSKTDLQQKITELARQLRYTHEKCDCCLTEDPRKTGLKNGLRQLTIEQLERVLNYPGEMVLDTYNYQDGKFCALAVALELDKIMSNPTHEKVYDKLVSMNYSVYNTRGIEGKFYTNNRLEDLLEATKEVLQEKYAKQ